MRKLLETTVIIIGTLGWWGFVYPELSMTETETVSFADDSIAGDTADGAANADVADSDAADSGRAGNVKEIRIKSRLVEYVCEIKEKQEKDLNHDK